MHTRPRSPLGALSLWLKNHATQTKSATETRTPAPPTPDRPRAAARFVLLQYALHDDGTLRGTLETLARQGDTGRADVTRMLCQASRAAAQYSQAAPATQLTRTGEHSEVNTHITDLHALLLAMQTTPAEAGDVLIVTLAATMTERRTPPADLPSLLEGVPENTLLRTQISWSPAQGPLFTAEHARNELAALAAHLRE